MTVFDANLSLLDRQVLDVDGRPVMVVDDVEIDDVAGGGLIPVGAAPPEVTALVSGPVLLMRVFGGRAPGSRLLRVPWRVVADLGTALRLGVLADTLEVGWTERWVRDHIIARIPGGRHDPQ